MSDNPNVPVGGLLRAGECCYILSQARVYPVTYCRKFTGFEMKRDDDHNLRRVYHHHCPEHRVVEELLSEEEE